MTEEDSWRINKYKIQIREIQNELELVKFLEFSLMLSLTSRKIQFVSYSYLNAILGTSNTGQLLFFASDTASTTIVSSPLVVPPEKLSRTTFSKVGNLCVIF